MSPLTLVDDRPPVIMVCLPLRLSLNVFERGIPVKCRYLNDTQLFLKFACMFGSKKILCGFKQTFRFLSADDISSSGDCDAVV